MTCAGVTLMQNTVGLSFIIYKINDKITQFFMIPHLHIFMILFLTIQPATCWSASSTLFVFGLQAITTCIKTSNKTAIYIYKVTSEFFPKTSLQITSFCTWSIIMHEYNSPCPGMLSESSSLPLVRSEATYRQNTTTPTQSSTTSQENSRKC